MFKYCGILRNINEVFRSISESKVWRMFKFECSALVQRFEKAVLEVHSCGQNRRRPYSYLATWT